MQGLRSPSPTCQWRRSGRTVTWASGAPAVASVSASGLVSGLAAGTAPITATSGGASDAAAITATAPPSTSTAHQYYGAPTGSDASPCSATSPCYTMQRVSQLMSPGDTAHFAAGNYTWSYSANHVTKSGTATALLTYISDTKWGAKIYGSDCSPIANDGDYVQIINFDVTGSCPQGITTNGNYSKVIGNRVHDLPGSSGGYGGIVGPCCDYTVTGIQIIGNVVDNIGLWGQVNLIHGIYVAGPYAVVENNIVTRGAAACIQSYHGATHQIISNNTVANCGRYGIQVSADPTLTTNDYTTVNNNIIVNGGGYGISQGYSLGSHNVFNNNIFYNNSAGNISSPTSGTSATQSGTITLTSAQFSALFVNYTGDITGDHADERSVQRALRELHRRHHRGLPSPERRRGDRRRSDRLRRQRKPLRAGARFRWPPPAQGHGLRHRRLRVLSLHPERRHACRGPCLNRRRVAARAHLRQTAHVAAGQHPVAHRERAVRG